ncbi:hypothetical protein F9U64_00430 [Gracilibacillus oryzae]|uniref:Uncharacterized protein n=1 Tax=Gracilibacillus oryzae TaxID=1672701 RepID=A0A7C8GX16_9BACI|nr:tetratricopeptide repeat protein [Gracilibacillus oryzae]KAB8139444.1 hypothetical protein F9U64_00430 [Gracilibacillus oryzae]
MKTSAIINLENQVKDESLSGVDRLYLHDKIARFYMEEDNYALASHHFQQATKNRYTNTESEKVWLEAHSAFAKLAEQFKQYNQARMTLAKVLQYLEKNNKPIEAIASVCQRIGWLFFREGEYHQAHTQLEQAQKLFLEVLDGKDPRVLRVNDQLADVYIGLEQPELAIRLHEKHFETNSQFLKEEEKALLLIKIGELSFHTDLKKARKTIIEGMERVKEENPLFIRGSMLLAEIEETLGAFPRAIKYYKDALCVVEEPFLVVFLHAKLGTLYLKTAQKEEAQSFLEKGLPLSADYPKIRMQFLYALGKIYSDQKNYELAFEMYTSFLQGLDAEGKTRTLAYANTLQAIAYNYLVQEDINNALVRYSEALNIYNKLGSNCREEKGLAAIRLAYCYREMGDLSKAEVYYKQGTAVVEKVKDKGLKEEALMAIIDFYRMTNQSGKSSVYENKLIKLSS